MQHGEEKAKKVLVFFPLHREVIEKRDINCYEGYTIKEMEKTVDMRGKSHSEGSYTTREAD